MIRYSVGGRQFIRQLYEISRWLRRWSSVGAAPLPTQRILTLPVKLSTPLPFVGASTQSNIVTISWNDDSGNLVSVVGHRIILMGWLQRMKRSITSGLHSYDATVGPQT
jgi:hypothetical protein